MIKLWCKIWGHKWTSAISSLHIGTFKKCVRCKKLEKIYDHIEGTEIKYIIVDDLNYET